MGVPRVPRDVLYEIIDRNSHSFTRYRTTESVSASGVTDQSVSTATVNLYVTAENNSHQQLPHGEARGQTIDVLARPTTDVIDGDEIEYDGERWELTVTKVPNASDPDYLRIVGERADTA